MEKMASTERTPLITTVTIGSVPRRYPHNTLRRFCTIILGASLVGLFATFLFTVVFAPHDEPPSHPTPHPPGHRHPMNGFTFDQLKDVLLETPSAEKASEWSRYYTAGPHLAGRNLSQAEWTRDRWNEWGVKSDIVAYDTYLNYPLGHRLALLEKSKTKSDSWNVTFEATLEEEVLDEDPTSSLPNRIPTFHGYSASGNVTAPFVYVNYGTYQDFEDLVKANISLAGHIALARYGGIFRGLKVKRAQELGMIGCVIFTDPGDDGEVTDENGYETYPNGPARHPSSVQRGSVQFLSVAPGDPTTPGYPSKPGVPRQPVDGAIPSIPSLPISYAEAVPILKALNGYGPKATEFNRYWTKNTGLKYKGDYTITPQWDVIGIINGTIPDEVIVVGNHRDAWIAGGAGDPNSGSAVLNEAIRSFGKALEKGWKPLRTIVFASWDGEEYGLIGSTEWVENTFRGFRPPTSPTSTWTWVSVSPNQTVKGQTVRDTWDGHISTMGSGSDFTAFQDYAGIPSLDFGFGGYGPDSPIYQYHSNYDSYHWMSEFGDPKFAYHKTMAQILGLTVGKLADTPVVLLNATDYATALKGYVEKIEAKLASVDAKSEPSTDEDIVEFRARSIGSEPKGDIQDFKFSLTRLYDSLAEFTSAAIKLDMEATKLTEEAGEHIPWWRLIKKLKLFHAIRSTNTKYKKIERSFLFQGGLDGRTWFKHVVFAPGLWTGYAGAVFPGLTESIDDKDSINALRWVDIIDNCIKSATKTIQ
ncbi:PA domain-containing protein [Apiospora phragmitis]|uniref:PA domain-containing protein n=1 Tax=Apiospora phragmitis TaxID=2905665 RepID=A0ABR1UR72_9PEZI